MDRAGKNRGFFFDGTFKKIEHLTNVSKLALSVTPQDANGKDQTAYYYSGIGTNTPKIPIFSYFNNRVIGATGWRGYTYQIKASYYDLINPEDGDGYSVDDKIFLNGYSRGAVSAMALLDFIDTMGVIDVNKLPKGKKLGKVIDRAYRLYHKYEGDPNHKKIIRFREKYSIDGDKGQAFHRPHVENVSFIDPVAAMDLPDEIFMGKVIDGKSWKPPLGHIPGFVETAFVAYAKDEARAVLKPLEITYTDETDYVGLLYKGDHGALGGKGDTPEFQPYSNYIGLEFAKEISYRGLHMDPAQVDDFFPNPDPLLLQDFSAKDFYEMDKTSYRSNFELRGDIIGVTNHHCNVMDFDNLGIYSKPKEDIMKECSIVLGLTL